MTTPVELVIWITTQFELRQNPEKAIAMAAYMKNRFPFWGIQSPEQNQVSKAIFLKVTPLVTEEWLCQVAELLWQQEQREYQYCAIQFLVQYGDRLSTLALTTIEQFMTTKSWWDTIDPLAIKVVGNLVRRFSLSAALDAYSTHENLWLRRVAILHQLSFKQQTDQERLFSYCTLNASSKEFFIQKAIGRALREYAKTDEDAVLTYVCAHHQNLSNLSKREALKHLPVDWRHL